MNSQLHPLVRRGRLVLVAGLALVGFAACGDDEDSADSTSAPVEATADTTAETTAATTADTVAETTVAATSPDTTEATETTTASSHDDGHDAPTLQIGLEDYAFTDVPASAPAGTKLGVTNASTKEVHELIAVLLPEDEQRDIIELRTLGMDQLGPLVGTEPAAVLVAPPGQEGFAVVGDGTLTEPGRYLLLCIIPTGADPTEYLEAAATGEGPPQVDGGAPHYMNGMMAEIEITA